MEVATQRTEKTNLVLEIQQLESFLIQAATSTTSKAYEAVVEVATQRTEKTTLVLEQLKSFLIQAATSTTSTLDQVPPSCVPTTPGPQRSHINAADTIMEALSPTKPKIEANTTMENIPASAEDSTRAEYFQPLVLEGCLDL